MRMLPRLLIVLSVFLFAQLATAQTRITCASEQNQPSFCPAETRGGVRLARQLSSAACREGDTWGYDRRGIWVDRGCRAEFELSGGWSSGRPEIITCSSENRRRQFCPADTRGGVRLARQISDAACRQGSSWGYDNTGIWVDRGCRAEFEVTSSGWGWGGGGRDRGDRDLGGIATQTITCESRDRRRQVCAADIRGTVRLARQLSDATCREGSSWGYDQRGIWVDRGCRGVFEVRGRDRDRDRDRGRDRDRRYGPRGNQWSGNFAACANEVVARFRGVSPREVELQDATQGGVGTQLIEWRAPNGSSGYCRVNRNGKVVQFKQD